MQNLEDKIQAYIADLSLSWGAKTQDKHSYILQEGVICVSHYESYVVSMSHN